MNYALQRNHLLSFLCIYITQTIAGSIQKLSSTDSYIQQSKSETIIRSTLSTSTRYSTPSNESYLRRPFGFNVKIIAILLACFIFIFVLIRLCVMACKSSRSLNSQVPHRRRSVVQPQVAVVGMNEFKPDLPPAYAEAITNIDTDGSKLPSYEEIRRERT